MGEPTVPPTASGCPGEFYYRGTPFTATSVDILENIRSFMVHDDDVFIAAYPKSGANLTMAIAKAVMRASTFKTFSPDKEADKPTPPFEYRLTQDLLPTMPRPRILHTHLTPSLVPDALKHKTGKVIHVLRNPNDVAVSYYQFHRMNKNLGNYQGSWNDFFPYFIRGEVIWGKWDTFVSKWICESDCINVLHVKYEDMISDPHNAVKTIADFLGRPVTQDQVNIIVQETSFQRLKNNPAFSFNLSSFNQNISPFMRSGKVGDWKNYFSEEQEKDAKPMYESFVRKTGVSLQF